MNLRRYRPANCVRASMPVFGDPQQPIWFDEVLCGNVQKMSAVLAEDILMKLNFKKYKSCVCVDTNPCLEYTRRQGVEDKISLSLSFVECQIERRRKNC